MDKYGLVGYPLKHSFSYRFFREKFNNEGIDADYNNYELEDINTLPEIIRSDKSLKGLNVTIPYKEKVIAFLDELDDTAQAIGAVNVIKIIREGDTIKMKGYNTDVIGFRESIAPLIDRNFHKKALILGTGGASKAILYGLRNLGIDGKLVSRSSRKGQFTYDDLNDEILQEYRVIVNCSPIGTYPNVDECPAIPYQYLTPNHLLYDLVYNPEVTKFLSKGNNYGAKTKNGAEMLKFQALGAWEIWCK